MMFTIGAFLLLLGVLMDDGTSWFLFAQGWHVMETNPVYLKLGIPGLIGISLVFYMLLLYMWKTVIEWNRKSITEKQFHKKWYDIFVFLFCFLIISMTTEKIELGYNNIDRYVDYMKDKDYAEKIDIEILKLETQKQNNPTEFQSERINLYYEDINNISMFREVLNLIFSFLLFKVGNKTVPWDLA